MMRWIAERRASVVKRWHGEIESRGEEMDQAGDALLQMFLDHLVTFLAFCMGPNRARAEEVWGQATNLYGSFALQRGLAAGEVVEEFLLLRETVLRLFLESPSGAEPLRRSGRELLTLNRILDRGMVRASVSYVDELFFAHLQGSGVPEGVTPEVQEEIEEQLEALRKEMEG